MAIVELLYRQSVVARELTIVDTPWTPQNATFYPLDKITVSDGYFLLVVTSEQKYPSMKVRVCLRFFEGLRGVDRCMPQPREVSPRKLMYLGERKRTGQ